MYERHLVTFSLTTRLVFLFIDSHQTYLKMNKLNHQTFVTFVCCQIRTDMQGENLSFSWHTNIFFIICHFTKSPSDLPENALVTMFQDFDSRLSCFWENIVIAWPVQFTKIDEKCQHTCIKKKDQCTEMVGVVWLPCWRKRGKLLLHILAKSRCAARRIFHNFV